MAEIDEIVKKVKEMKEREERIYYLEGLLKILKDKNLIKKVEALLRIVKESEEKEKIPMQEIIEPRRELSGIETEIKYEQQTPRERIQPRKGLERTVENQPQERRSSLAEEEMREYYLHVQRQTLLERAKRTQESAQGNFREPPRYLPQELQRDTTQYRGSGEFLQQEMYQRENKIPEVGVRNILEKETKEKEKHRVKLLRGEGS